MSAILWICGGGSGTSKPWKSVLPGGLLDVETGGLDREKDNIIALRLARLEGLETVKERTILNWPEDPLTPQAKQLTGISN